MYVAVSPGAPSRLRVFSSNSFWIRFPRAALLAEGGVFASRYMRAKFMMLPTYAHI